MISVQNLSKIYPGSRTPAIKSLNFEINKSEVLGMVGLNGAGKTTTLKILAGVMKPTQGYVKVDDIDLVKNKEYAVKNLGWVSETPNWEQNVKPMTLMKYFAGFYGIKGKDAETISRKLLEMVGLDKSLNKKIVSFSQGMKKRFALAESLINNPSYILMDETLNGLDPEGVKLVRDLIIQFKKEGKGIVLSSHILSEVQNLADRVLIIHRGSVIKVIKKEEFMKGNNLSFRIKIKNPDGNLENILSKFGQVTNANDFYLIKDPQIDYDSGYQIVADLVTNNYKVLSFEPVNESLEQYFFKIIGGAN